MKRSSLVLAAALAAAVVGATAATRMGRRAPAGVDRTGGPPNVVLLILDTVRADRLGMYAADVPEGLSTELDARAAGGVRFTNAVATAPWTRPSIGALLTGRPGRQLGLYEERGDALRDEHETLAEVLGANGWHTVGLTANPNINRAFNFHQGFDEYVDSNVVWEWMTTRPGDVVKDRHTGLVPAKDLYARALELVADDTGPIYLQIDVMDVHEWSIPQAIRPEFRGLYKDRPDHAYLQTVRQVSIDTEAFLDELLARPGWERTLVVITSDHGEGLFDHPSVARSKFHGSLLYRSQLEVPLVLTSTVGDLPAGATPDRLVTLQDVMPTILDYAGLPAAAGIEGASLLPLVYGTEGTVRDRPQHAFVETRFRDWDKVGVVTPEWTFVVNRGEPHGGTSPRELQPWHGLVDGTATDRTLSERAVAEELAGLLTAWDTGTPAAEAWVAEVGQTEAELEQLKALGYLE